MDLWCCSLALWVQHLTCTGPECSRASVQGAVYCQAHGQQLRRTGRTLPLGWRRGPNAIEIDGNTTWIILSDSLGQPCGRAAVDTSSYDKVKHLRWGLLDPRGYVVHNKSKTFLHRLLTGAEEGQDVDHIDGDPLNNRGRSMRVVSHALNCQNVLRRPENPAIRNVYFVPKNNKTRPWRVQTLLSGKVTFGGYFATREEAEATAKILREDTFSHHNESRHL